MIIMFLCLIYILLILMGINIMDIKKNSEKQTQILKDILEELKRGKNV